MSPLRLAAAGSYPPEGVQPCFFTGKRLRQDVIADTLAHQISCLKVSPVTKPAPFWNRLAHLAGNRFLTGSTTGKSPVRLPGLAVTEERGHSGYLSDQELPVLFSAVAGQLNWSPDMIGQVKAMKVTETNLNPNRRLTPRRYKRPWPHQGYRTCESAPAR